MERKRGRDREDPSRIDPQTHPSPVSGSDREETEETLPSSIDPQAYSSLGTRAGVQSRNGTAWMPWGEPEHGPGRWNARRTADEQLLARPMPIDPVARAPELGTFTHTDA